MTFEDIPEMRIDPRNSMNGEIKFSSMNPIKYNSRFTLMKGSEEKYYIYSQEDTISHLTLVETHNQNVYWDYNVGKEAEVLRGRGTFYGVSGGFLSINKDSIRVFGESEKFGKFDRSVVEPIVQRWAEKHLNFPSIIVE